MSIDVFAQECSYHTCNRYVNMYVRN